MKLKTKLKQILSMEIIKDIANGYCKEEPGFEGAETYARCRECVICSCKDIVEESSENRRGAK